MDNLEIEKNTMSVGDGGMAQQPAAMPAPEPVITPQQPAAMPTPAPAAVEPTPMQQMPSSEPVMNRVEAPMETTMQPIDLSGQGLQSPGVAPTGGGKKKLVVIAVVVVVGLLAGLGGFLFWRASNAPAGEAPVGEEVTANPITIPEMQPVETPAAPEMDSITTIEDSLNTMNAATIDAELQGGLNTINAAL